MSADPWIVLAGHLQGLAIGGRRALTFERRETIKDAIVRARAMFVPNTTTEPTRHQVMLLAVADVVAWDKWSDDRFRLLMAAVSIDKAWREELKHIERMTPVATSARYMKGARG